MQITRIAKKQFTSILFCDLDGVLNNEDSSGHIDIEMVEHLNHILRATGAGVVLSTGWRNDARMVRELASVIWNFKERYIGNIPDLGAERSFWNGDHEVNRWDEIECWLAHNGYTGAYAVLDDRADMVREHPHFFHTVDQQTGETGLTREMADRVVEHLGT